MNRFLKTFFASLIAIAVIFSVGCQGTVATTLSDSYFLKNIGNNNVIGNVNETCYYDVTFTSDNTEAGVTISLIDDEGYNTYTTHLVNTTYNGTECYLLETSLVTKVAYTINGETFGPYEDTIETKAYFLGVQKKLQTLYSTRSVWAHSPTKSGSKTVINEYKYQISTTYTDNTSANVSFVKEVGEFDIDEQREYTKLNKSTYYFDNEVMLFMPRAINLTDTSSLSFTSIDPLAGANRTIVMQYNSDKPNEKLVFSDVNDAEGVIKHFYYINNRKISAEEDQTSQIIPCQIVNFAISGTFSGSPIKCWYANTSLQECRARLIKMETIAPYYLGVFTYIINKTEVSD